MLSQPPDQPYEVITASSFDLETTSMRIHELALHYWLNKRFLIQQGIPVPVFFSKPMHLFADARKLWGEPNSPLQYLLTAKDNKGTPLYQPFPAPLALPILSINRINWRYDSSRSFTSFWQRNAGWPTVSKDVAREDLGMSYQCYMPQAWNFGFQIDFYSTRPDSQAFFISRLMQAFFGSQAEPDVWIKCVYPGSFGKKLVRLKLEGDITDATEEEPAEGFRVYRTTTNWTLEGWVIDLNRIVIPVMWSLLVKAKAVSPNDLNGIYESTIELQKDLRGSQTNGVFNSAVGLPPQ